MSSMIKADGQFAEFFSRPIAATLGVLVIVIWTLPMVRLLLRTLHGEKTPSPN